MQRELSFVAAAPQRAAERLDASSVHVWRIAHARAQRRQPMRRLLAAYLDLPESSVELIDDARGKPTLSPGLVAAGGERLEFNWTHSGDYALVALARGVAPGVDIERHHTRANALALARRFFAADEAAALAALDGAARDHAFLALWCAKEALLKASGDGLSFGLARLRFAYAEPGWRLDRLDPALGAVADWQLTGFAAASGYHAALAWRGGPRTLHAYTDEGA